METKRLLDVLDKQLATHQFVSGDEYTIADMAIWPWFGVMLRGGLYEAAEFLDADTYQHVQRWAEEIAQRPPVRRGSIVNRTWGDVFLAERHDSRDFSGLTL